MTTLHDLMRRIIFIGTYPPRQCGIATFTHDLLKNIQLLEPSTSFGVFAMNQTSSDNQSYPPEVVGKIIQDDRSTYTATAERINQFGRGTLVIIQHEYGIYQNDYLFAFMQALKCPIITTFHTVIADPVPTIRQVTQKLIKESDCVVTLTDTSRLLLSSLYPEVRPKEARILHGIHPLIFTLSDAAKPALELADRQILLTFGLLSRNKGIEHVIRALPAIVARFPQVLYLIVGGTHPNVLKLEGEAYRQTLTRLVEDLALDHHVRFINRYIPTSELLAYLQATDIYIAPSLDPEQTVSGTLSYALGTGRAVVATEFAQAKEIIDESLGLTVPIGQPIFITQAIIELLNQPQKLQSMHQAAYQATRSMLWSNSADDYLGLATKIIDTRDDLPRRWPDPILDHLETLTDGFGLIQFAKQANPDHQSGYTLDDNCRALQALDWLVRIKPDLIDRANALATIYLRVVRQCLNQKKPANYLAAATYRPTPQNRKESLEDSFARAAYALQTTTASPLVVAKTAQQLLKLVPERQKTAHLRPIAFRLLAACAAFEQGEATAHARLTRLANQLVAAYHKNGDGDWPWFEPHLTYANALFSASLLEAARLTGDPSYQKIGLQTLEFLCQICFMGPVYVPIGQAGWYVKGGQRTLFDQQPEDVSAMLLALVSAYQLTDDEVFAQRGSKAFSWFMGNNLLGMRMYDDATGGCHDGLTPRGPNANEGAESTVSYLMARLLMEKLPNH